MTTTITTVRRMTPLSLAMRAVLFQLSGGPVHDGNILSKFARDALVLDGFVLHGNGYAALSSIGRQLRDRLAHD